MSLVRELAALSEEERREVLSSLSDSAAERLLWDWEVWARPEQLPPEEGDWSVFLFLGGRGSGKTRAGAEWVRRLVERGEARRIALVAPTAADARDVMVEGESGVLSVSPPWFRPTYEPTKRRLTWPNGAMAIVFSADQPNRLRGPQFDAAWADELAYWRYPAAWDNLLLALRLGRRPRVFVSTTPRPIPLLRRLMKHPSTVVSRSTTYDNRENLAESFFQEIVSRYEGTRLGRQELMGELLDDAEGALWTRDVIEACTLPDKHLVPDLARVVVAVDPAMTGGDESAETGIVVAGRGVDGHAYVLADLSCRESPNTWARKVVGAYYAYQADRVVAENNQGGELVESVLRAVEANVSYKGIHATRGKVARAEPVAALYEQRKVHHVGCFPELEDQMCQYVPGQGPSPDRLDALVYAITDLMLEGVQRSWGPMLLDFGRRASPWRV